MWNYPDIVYGVTDDEADGLPCVNKCVRIGDESHGTKGVVRGAGK